MGVKAVFVNAKEQREIPAGTAVFSEGDAGQEMFGLVSGAIELRHLDQVVAKVEPGDTFGEIAIIKDAPRSLTAVATEAAVVAVIDRPTFLFLVHETPMFAIQVMRSLADRLLDHDRTS